MTWKKFVAIALLSLTLASTSASAIEPSEADLWNFWKNAAGDAVSEDELDPDDRLALHTLAVLLGYNGTTFDRLRSIDGSLQIVPPAGIGQKPMAQSLACVLPSDQTAIPVTQSGNFSARMQDGAGNALTSSTTDPVGSERGLIVRNIPSGTQPVSQPTASNLKGQMDTMFGGSPASVGNGNSDSTTQRVTQAADIPIQTYPAAASGHSDGRMTCASAQGTAIPSSALSNRKKICFTNLGGNGIYHAYRSNVATSGSNIGLYLAPYDTWCDEMAGTRVRYCIAVSSDQDIFYEQWAFP